MHLEIVYSARTNKRVLKRQRQESLPLFFWIFMTSSYRKSAESTFASVVGLAIRVLIWLPICLAWWLVKSGIELLVLPKEDKSRIVVPEVVDEAIAWIIVAISFLSFAILLYGALGALPLPISTSLLLGYTAFALYRNRARRVKIRRLETQNLSILNGNDKGEAGEIATRDMVSKIFVDLGVQWWAPAKSSIESVILLPTNESDLSSEIDHLVVCEFGVYVIEVKNWAGSIEPHETPGQLKLTYSDGKTSMRTDPLKLTWSKANLLCAGMPRNSYKALVVFSHPTAELTGFSSSYIRLQDLPRYFEDEQAKNYCFSADINEVVEALLEHVDREPDAKHRHLMRLPDTTDDIVAYKKNIHDLQTLRQRKKSFNPMWWIAASMVMLPITVSIEDARYERNLKQRMAAQNQASKQATTSKTQNTDHHVKPK